MNRSTIVFVPVLFGLLGCATLYPSLPINRAINKYNLAKTKIDLGDTKEKVLSFLEPTQRDIPQFSKDPDKYRKGSDLIEIYYFRSGLTRDGLKTDDEFTPYTFKNGTLEAIGWEFLGGPKTKGQIIQPPSQVNVNVENKTER